MCATCVLPYRLIDYSPLQPEAALQPLPEWVYCFLSPCRLSHFHFTLSHFVSVVSPGWLSQVVLYNVIDTLDWPIVGYLGHFVRRTISNDSLISYLPILFLIVLCSLNIHGPRAILSSVTYFLDHSPIIIELSFWHSLCTTCFIITALNIYATFLVKYTWGAD